MAFHLRSSSLMKICFASRIAGLTAVVMIAGACDREAPVRTRDEIAADSALAADLALANRDTLLIDSIGQYRPAEGAVVDTAVTPTSPKPATAPSRPPASAPVRSSATPKRRAGGDPCNSPRAADQQACVHTSLAAADMRLNRVYRALLTEMRRREGMRPGQKDPPSVERMRAGQRAWLVYRDTECRRRGRGTEGPLWAGPRVRCLGEFSVRRTNELADNFSRLTAR